MTLLLLAGSGESRRLASRIAKAGIPAIASLAGSTRSPRAIDLPHRAGGFGGEAGFRAYLAREGISAILDATHPFAHRISARTARVAKDLGLPYLQLLRPPWTPGPGDNWVELAREEDAGDVIPKGATVFLATGRQTLERFGGLADRRLICRQIDPPSGPFPFPNGMFLVGRPPFSVADERTLFQDLGIDWLVVKNAGGAASRTKLDAARELGIPVAMISRPPQPDAPRVDTEDAAMAWVKSL